MNIIRYFSLEKAILWVAAAGLFVAICLDFALTYSGIVFLGIGIMLPVVGRAGLALGYSFVLAATQFASELTLANRARPSGTSWQRWRNVFAVFAMLTIQSAGATLHFVQLVNLEDGERLEQTQASDLAALTTQAMGIDRTIQAAYQRAIAVENRLGAQSAAGLDETRISRCGGLCRNAYQNARLIQERYADLALPINPALPSGDARTASAQFATLTFILNSLQRKNRSYLAMCRMIGWTCVDPTLSISTSPTYRRLHDAFSDVRVPDRQVLVLAAAAADLSSIRRGDPSLRTVLIGVFVAALPAAELVLVIFLGTILAAIGRADEMDLDEAHRRNALLDEMLEMDAEIAAKEAAHRANAGRFNTGAEDAVPA